jgi:hypothetical protein
MCVASVTGKLESFVFQLGSCWRTELLSLFSCQDTMARSRRVVWTLFSFHKNTHVLKSWTDTGAQEISSAVRETGVQDTSSAVRMAKGKPFLGYQDILDRNWGSRHLFSCQAGERRAFLRMSGYPGQKLGLRTPLQLSGWRKESPSSDVRIFWTETGAQDTSSAARLANGEPFFGCQDILDRNWGSGHLFSCQAGEWRAFLRMSGYPGQKLGLRTHLQLSGLAKEKPFFVCQDIQDINWCSGYLFSCPAGERRAFLRMSGYSGQNLGLRTPLQKSGWRKESLSLDDSISWTETGAQNTSSAVRLAKGEPYFDCQDILDRNCCQDTSSAVGLQERNVVRTPLQLSGWRKESLTLDVRISWTETGAQESSSAVRLA